jgi:hypothetical protein
MFFLNFPLSNELLFLPWSVVRFQYLTVLSGGYKDHNAPNIKKFAKFGLFLIYFE